MQFHTLGFAGAAALALSLTLGPAAEKSGPGEPMPNLDLTDYSDPNFTSLGDFYGQAVLLEFFAHW